jgi:hypothetical protein
MRPPWHRLDDGDPIDPAVKLHLHHGCDERRDGVDDVPRIAHPVRVELAAEILVETERRSAHEAGQRIGAEVVHRAEMRLRTAGGGRATWRREMLGMACEALENTLKRGCGMYFWRQKDVARCGMTRDGEGRSGGASEARGQVGRGSFASAAALTP